LLVSYNVAELYDVSAPHPWIALVAALFAVGSVFGLRTAAITLGLALALPTAVYVATKTVLVRLLLDEAHALGAAELLITATTLAAGVLALRYLEAVHNVVGKVLGETADGTLRPFLVGQDDIYREIRRARVYQRPLTILAFAREENRERTGLPFEQQMQQELIDKAAAARIAALLARERTDCDVIVKHGNHLIMALPAVTREEAQRFAQRFADLSASNLGLKLRVGCATFPDDGLTFETLVQFAEAATHEAGEDVAAATEAPHAAKDRARPLPSARPLDTRTEVLASSDGPGRHALVRAAATGGAAAIPPTEQRSPERSQDRGSFHGEGSNGASPLLDRSLLSRKRQ
jgi:hypothetical protein